jgi:hypothetical protein
MSNPTKIGIFGSCQLVLCEKIFFNKDQKEIFQDHFLVFNSFYLNRN